jgi:hypothetical protein
MQTVSHHLVQHAQQLAREVTAQAVLIYADTLRQDGELGQLLQPMDFPTVLVTRSDEPDISASLLPAVWVRVPNVPMTRAGQLKAALLVCLARGFFTRAIESCV